MIVCSECESAYYLRLLSGDIDIRDGVIAEIEERYKCFECGNEGYYWFLAGEEHYSGIVEGTADVPRTTNAKGIDT